MNKERTGEKVQDSGHVEVITGCMFSGKSDELISRLRRAVIARKNIQVFKPLVDTRSNGLIKSHCGTEFEALEVCSSKEILLGIKESSDVIAIDEAQFFDEKLPEVCQALAKSGYRVIVSGLDTDFRGEPFGCMPSIMAQSEYLTKQSAICMICGEPATRTQRLINGKPANYNDPLVVIGAADCYEARCRKHHEVPGKIEN